MAAVLDQIERRGFVLQLGYGSASIPAPGRMRSTPPVKQWVCCHLVRGLRPSHIDACDVAMQALGLGVARRNDIGDRRIVDRARLWDPPDRHGNDLTVLAGGARTAMSLQRRGAPAGE
jgi:hypothetical protein